MLGVGNMDIYRSAKDSINIYNAIWNALAGWITRDVSQRGRGEGHQAEDAIRFSFQEVQAAFNNPILNFTRSTNYGINKH